MTTQHTRELIALLIVVICLIVTAHALTKNKCKKCGDKLIWDDTYISHKGICCRCAGCK